MDKDRLFREYIARLKEGTEKISKEDLMEAVKYARVRLERVKIHLMNSAMMPQSGTYTQKMVKKEEFKREFEKYAKSGFESYIGYPETARILSDFLDMPVPVSRKETRLADGDIIFVARLEYRLQNPHEKAENRTKTIEDFVFSIVYYTEY